MSSLKKCLFRYFSHFLTGLFFCIEFYELLVYFGNESLLVVSFSTVFSHSEGCLFTLLAFSFAMQKLLSLIKFHLFILFLFPLL